MKKILLYTTFMLIVSCGTIYELPQTYTLVSKNIQTVDNPQFRVGEEYLYRASIKAYGHQFGGLLVIKIAGEHSWRTALTTDFGNTLLDLSLEDNKRKINSIQEALNHKIVVNTLFNDFESLLTPSFTVLKAYNNEGVQAWQCNDGKNAVYIFKDDNKNTFTQLNLHREKPYTTFIYSPFDGDEKHKTITVDHHTLDIQITLNPLQ